MHSDVKYTERTIYKKVVQIVLHMLHFHLKLVSTL